MSRSFHLVISVRGMLHWPDREVKRNLKWITNGKGERYGSAAAFRSDLMDELSKGHEVLSTGECDNHDWKTGCGGHESVTAVPPQSEPSATSGGK